MVVVAAARPAERAKRARVVKECMLTFEREWCLNECMSVCVLNGQKSRPESDRKIVMLGGKG